MKLSILLTTAILLAILPAQAFAQSTELQKFEIAAEFTTLKRENFGSASMEAGLGVRFTYNLNKSFALEASTSIFPDRCHTCSENGRILQLVGGLKAGKRFQNWGIFGKVRPGVVNFTEGDLRITQTGSGSFPFEFRTFGVDAFATDLGAVLEFYPSKRIVTRFDAGDTILRFGSRSQNGISFDPATNTYSLIPFTVPSRTTHNFQFSASVGFRF